MMRIIRTYINTLVPFLVIGVCPVTTGLIVGDEFM